MGTQLNEFICAAIINQAHFKPASIDIEVPVCVAIIKLYRYLAEMCCRARSSMSNSIVLWQLNIIITDSLKNDMIQQKNLCGFPFATLICAQGVLILH